jgi:hypothetical protein
MGLITKLQAVNQMLLASGENLVADLDGDSGIDTGIAETILDQVSLDYQMRGMANNKVVKKFTPDDNGYITLPTEDTQNDGLISAELVSRHINADNWLIRARIMNTTTPPRLYNLTDDTDIWEEAVDGYYVELIRKTPWDNLDTPVQRAIMTTAMRQYQIITQGDEGSDAFLGYQEQVYSAKGKAADINDKKRNIFNTNSVMRNAAYRNAYNSDPNRFRYWNTRGF